jgi:hypothetical protein
MKISPIEIAKAHIEEAIVQYFDKSNFIIATTLAGIAEEILGKILPPEKTRARQELIESIKNAPEEQNLLVTGYFSGRPVLIEKTLSELSHDEIGNHLSFAKNSFKHTIKEIEIEPQEESKNLLISAFTRNAE